MQDKTVNGITQKWHQCQVGSLASLVVRDSAGSTGPTTVNTNATETLTATINNFDETAQTPIFTWTETPSGGSTSTVQTGGSNELSISKSPTDISTAGVTQFTYGCTATGVDGSGSALSEFDNHTVNYNQVTQIVTVQLCPGGGTSINVKITNAGGYAVNQIVQLAAASGFSAGSYIITNASAGSFTHSTTASDFRPFNSCCDSLNCSVTITENQSGVTQLSTSDTLTLVATAVNYTAKSEANGGFAWQVSESHPFTSYNDDILATTQSFSPDISITGTRKYRCTVTGTNNESFIGESLTYNISGAPVDRSYTIQPYTGTCPNVDDFFIHANYESQNPLPAGEAVSIAGDTRCFKVINVGGVPTTNEIDDTYGGGTAGCNSCQTAQARTDNCTATFSTGSYNAGSFAVTGTFGSSYSSTDSFSIGTNTGTVSPTSATVSELTSGLVIIASAGATLTLSSQSPANCVGNTHTIEVPLSTCNAVSVFFTNDNPATNTTAANKLCNTSGGSAKTAYMNGTTLASSSVIYVNSSCSSFLSGPKYFSEDNSNYYIWNGYSLSGPYPLDCP